MVVVDIAAGWCKVIPFDTVEAAVHTLVVVVVVVDAVVVDVVVVDAVVAVEVAAVGLVVVGIVVDVVAGVMAIAGVVVDVEGVAVVVAVACEVVSQTQFDHLVVVAAVDDVVDVEAAYDVVEAPNHYGHPVVAVDCHKMPDQSNDSEEDTLLDYHQIVMMVDWLPVNTVEAVRVPVMSMMSICSFAVNVRVVQEESKNLEELVLVLEIDNQVLDDVHSSLVRN